MDTATDITVMVTVAVAGGVHPFIIRPAGVAGMVVPGHMDTTEIHFTSIIMFM